MDYRLRIPIRIKLMMIVSSIILASLGLLTYIVLSIFEDDMSSILKLMNSRTNSLLAEKIDDDIKKKISDALFVHSLKMSRDRPQKLWSRYYSATSDIIITLAYASDQRHISRPAYVIYNPAVLGKLEITEKDIDIAIRKRADVLSRAFRGETVITNISPDLKVPAWMMIIPVINKNRVTAAVLNIYNANTLARLVEARASSRKTPAKLYESFLVDKHYKAIIHPVLDKTMKREDFSDYPVIRQMVKTKTRSGLLVFRYRDTGYFGAFTRLRHAGLTVISTIEAQKALEGVNIARVRSVLISLLIISVAILIVYYFSKTISTPISNLVKATKEIMRGNFQIKLHAKTADEIEDLTEAFNTMSSGLEEREKLKGAFGKFVNKEIAEQILKGDLRLGGERKKATIFFSDIRSFTSISESMDPAEVVEFLNEYMTQMVAIIHKYNGIVDKFIGDAIMALWGVPVEKGNELKHCLDATLEMRRTLIRFNAKRRKAGKPVILIGCGINTGVVLSGQIGSEDRLEYTVIGDEVNLASRIESLNKSFGTDILISQNTYSEIKDHYNVIPMQKIMVKGKSKAQQVYALLGRKDDPECPRTLAAVRKMVGIKFDHRQSKVQNI